MSDLIRFGVSLEKELVHKFDRLIKEEDYPNRSEAFRDLIREKLIKKEWTGKKQVAGTLTYVYDHHKRDLLNSLVDIQHDFQGLIISNQHVHLDHNNCLEVVVARGKAKEIEKLANKIRSIRGVKHAYLAMTTTGKEVS